MFNNITSAIHKAVSSLAKDKGEMIFICLGVTLTVSLIGLFIFGLFFDVEKDSFGRTITNTLLNIISVSVIGTLFTLLLGNYNRTQSQLHTQEENRKRIEENWDQYRKDALQRLQKLYAKTKNARRMLRAKGFPTPYYRNENDSNLMKQSVYDFYMEDINDSQLELEAIRQEITTERSIFSDPAKIISNLKDMDEYLGKMVSEYEAKGSAFTGDPATLKIGELKDIKSFLAHGDEGFFKTNFSRKCNEVRKVIRNDINFPPARISSS